MICFMQININEFYMSLGLSLKCYLSALTNKSRKTAWGIAVICSQALELQHQETYYADL